MIRKIKLFWVGLRAGFGFDSRSCETCDWWVHHGYIQGMTAFFGESNHSRRYGDCFACKGLPGMRSFVPGDGIGPRKDMNIVTRRDFFCKLWRPK